MPPLPDAGVEYLVGDSGAMTGARPLRPYDDLVLEFLNDLSRALLADAEAKREADIVAFAYWCRKANTARLKREFAEPRVRLGLGVVFHITPSNVPINFAFSLAFALLAGNASVVRVPTRDTLQVSIVCRAIRRLVAEPGHRAIAGMTVVVRYPPNDEITRAFSALCDGRIIWGGDETIRHIRSLGIPERSVEVVFADRYSLCAIDGASVLAADDPELARLAGGFFNDTYLMDQNACSSPHLVLWFGAPDVIERAQRRFWERVHAVAAARYQLQPVNAVDKYLQLCRNAIELDHVAGVSRHGNYVYRVELADVPDNVDTLRGRYGYVYEYRADDISRLAPVVNAKYQTVTYFGVDKAYLADFVVSHRLRGIDRIVPIGTALDIGVVWDGYDIVRSLSRIIDVH